MSLADGITQVLQSRGMTRRQLIERLPDQATRWAVYRLLSGRSFDPRFSGRVGQDTQAVLQDAGLSPHEISALVAQGAVQI